jgi:hypothetical protein
MRISSNPNDPGYNMWRATRKSFEILYNGILVSECVTVDDEEGYILKAALNERGKVYAEDDEVVMEELRGDVRIVWKEE